VSLVCVIPDATFWVFTAVKIQVEVFWVVTSCNGVVGYQRFVCPCWRWRQHGPLKLSHPTSALDGVTNQKTSICVVNLFPKFPPLDDPIQLSTYTVHSCFSASNCVIVCTKFKGNSW